MITPLFKLFIGFQISSFPCCFSVTVCMLAAAAVQSRTDITPSLTRFVSQAPPLSSKHAKFGRGKQKKVEPHTLLLSISISSCSLICHFKATSIYKQNIFGVITSFNIKARVEIKKHKCTNFNTKTQVSHLFNIVNHEVV